MKLHEFLESEYVSTNIDLQQEFSPSKQARTQAVQGLINAQRCVLRWTHYVRVLFTFLLVKLHIRSNPASAEDLVKDLKAKTRAAATQSNMHVSTATNTPGAAAQENPSGGTPIADA